MSERYVRALARAVADATGSVAVDVEPLNDVIDIEALSDFLASAGDEASVRVTIGEYRYVVRGDMSVDYTEVEP